MMKRFLLAVMFAGLSVGMAQADDTDRSSLIETVAAFKAAMGGGDFDAVMSMVPGKVFDRMADELEVTPERLNALVVEQMTTVMEDVKILDFEMQTAGFDIEETEMGTAYVFLPTRTIVEVQETKIETKSHTLALRDGDVWSLVRVDDAAQLKVLRDVYPGFAEIEFPPNTVKLLN